MPHWPVRESLLSSRLRSAAIHQSVRDRISTTFEDEARAFVAPLIDVFRMAAKAYPSVSVNPEMVAGTPCISGTRIPVYMILDAVEYYGTVESVLESYPRLTIQQIKDAIGFAKLVVECPIEH